MNIGWGRSRVQGTTLGVTLVALLVTLACAREELPDGPSRATSRAGADAGLVGDAGPRADPPPPRDSMQDREGRPGPDGGRRLPMPTPSGDPVEGVTCGVPASGFERRAPEHLVTTEVFCRLLEASGEIRCPRSRSELLADMEARCGVAEYFSLLERACGLDAVEYADPARITWYFDEETGALAGARSVDRALPSPCGDGIYWIGRTVRGCTSFGASACELCLAGDKRDEDCPADVVAELPSAACIELPSTGCSCGEAPDAPLPQSGTPCSSPTRCANCQSGTCWTECVCTLDGTPRWRKLCTE